jgi:hypothetical protein
MIFFQAIKLILQLIYLELFVVYLFIIP